MFGFPDACEFLSSMNVKRSERGYYVKAKVYVVENKESLAIWLCYWKFQDRFPRFIYERI